MTELLAQATVVPDRAWDYGIAAVVLVFIGAVIWRMLPWVKEYLDTQSHCSRQNTEINTRLASTVEGLGANMAFKMDPKGDTRYRDHVFSTYHTNNALRHLCEASRVIAEGKPQEAITHINQAQEALSK